MRKSFFGRTAQMIRMGIPDIYEGMEPVEPSPLPEPYIALDHVRHARTDGCRQTRSPYHDPVFAEGGQAVTCNDCQRSVWKATQKQHRKAA